MRKISVGGNLIMATKNNSEDQELFSDKLKAPDPVQVGTGKPETPTSTTTEVAVQGKSTPKTIEPREKVIVIDDSPTILAVISGILKKTGFNTLPYRDPRLALVDIKKMTPEELKDLKAIFSDLDMPNKTGLEVLQEIRAYEPTKNTPFVMITAQTERAQIQKAAILKVSGYLLKPVTTETMIELVGNLFPERAGVSKLKKTGSGK
jgi:two-component system chemotaxis response regulator CheY